MAERHEVRARTQGQPRAVVVLTILLTLLMLTGAACSIESNSSDPGTPDKTPTGSDSSSEDPAGSEKQGSDESAQETQGETAAVSQYDQPADESTVDDGVTDLVEQVDGTSVDVAGGGEVLAASAVDPQDASSQNAQAIADVDAYLTAVMADADRVWTQWFTSNGFSEPLVSYDVVTPTEPGRQMGCTGGDPRVFHDTPNAYYCSVDELQPGFRGAIYLPATTMLKTWGGDILGTGQQSRQAGDFAAAALAAHEFGHHVQDELSIQTTNALPVNGKYKELIADCFAGNWSANAYYQGYLEAGDFEEAVYALEAIGDHNYISPRHHGTPEERMEAFLRGYYGVQGGNPGDPATCIQYYWQ